MKIRFRLPGLVLLAAAIVGVVLFYGKGRSRSQANAINPPAISDNARNLNQTGQAAPVRVETSQVKSGEPNPLASLSLNDIKAMVRQKLREWAETKTEDDESRERLMETLDVLLTRENAAELTRMLSSDELSGPFGLKAFDRWLEANPAEAANWMATQPGATALQAHLVAQRLLTDEPALWTYCDGLADAGWRQTFLGEASLLAVSKNPVQAASLAQRMKPGKEQTNVVETVVYDWAVQDLKGAIGMVGTIADPVLHEKALVMTAKAIAMGDPDLGAQWLANAVKSEGALKETAQCVVEIWAERSPADAAKWLSQAADVNLRADAVNTLVHAWMKVDPSAAQAWVKTLPEGDRVQAMLRDEQAERDKAKD